MLLRNDLDQKLQLWQASGYALHCRSIVFDKLSFGQLSHATYLCHKKFPPPWITARKIHAEWFEHQANATACQFFYLIWGQWQP